MSERYGELRSPGGTAYLMSAGHTPAQGFHFVVTDIESGDVVVDLKVSDMAWKPSIEMINGLLTSYEEGKRRDRVRLVE